MSEISKLDENTSSLTDAINIRNYYSSIINNFVDIEYLDPDAIDYILNLYNVEVVEGENIVYNLHKWTNISYYLTLFIYENLGAINGGNFVSIDNDKTFGEINNEYNNLDSFDVKEMAAVCDIDSFKNDINNSNFIDEEAKANLNKQFKDLDKYKQMSLHLINFCNDFVMKLSGGSLKFQLYSYDTIINVLNENGENKLVEEFNAIKTKLEEYEASFQTKVNQASKAEREKYEKQLQKSTMTTEERLKKEALEQNEALSGELNTLKIEKKQFTIKQQLAEAKLPPLFANDVRLVNAEIADIPSVVKALTKEYADYQEQYGKPAVGGTAPQTTQTTSQNSGLIDQLVSSLFSSTDVGNLYPKGHGLFIPLMPCQRLLF
jgi:hypothetical protein